MKRIVIKIGTNALTNDDRTLNVELLTSLVKQYAEIRKDYDLLIVSSGAMGCGRTLIDVERYDEVTRRQLYAVVGQVKLMSTYASLFGEQNLNVAQMLVTKLDFGNRVHYLNTKNCLESLFKEGIVPIMNENDFVAVDELMFTDNDELAAMIAKMLIADKLIVLTNVEGVMDEKGELMREFSYNAEMPKHIVNSGKSLFGKGGMQSKFEMAKGVAESGTEVHIASAKVHNVALRIVEGEQIGTRFIPKL